jgi:uncharacterized protein (TIGR03032 family)
MPQADSLALFEEDGRALRDPAQVIPLPSITPLLAGDRLAHRVRGDFWGVLARLGIRLLVSREYEHLLVSLGVRATGRPDVSWLPLPHPSGVAVDRRTGHVTVALTRNPNQLLLLASRQAKSGDSSPGVLLPARTTFLPGSTYLHDIAYIGERLHVTAVGKNLLTVVGDDGALVPSWWPAIMDRDGGPDTRRNWLQLNSIAAGDTVQDSFFTASTSRRLRYPPGHLRFMSDRQGVIYSGRTREVITTGLTRPHSARLDGTSLWVDDSGYGTVGVVQNNVYAPVRKLPGWTRGLSIHGNVAFVGTSRLLPAFAHYAPGVGRAVCGIHAVDTRSGELLGSITWPMGNQIFAIEWIDAEQTSGLPYNRARSAQTAQLRDLFYNDSNWER